MGTNNSNKEAAGAQAAPPQPNSDAVRDAGQQFQADVLLSVQENQRTHENLSRLMDRPSDKILDLERKIGDVRSATEMNRQWMLYNRQ